MIQLFPPSVVLRIVPAAPTAKPLLVSINEKSCSVLPCGSGFCHTHCPDDEPAGVLFEILAATRLSACPLWIARVRAQIPLRIKLNGGILACVTFLRAVRCCCPDCVLIPAAYDAALVSGLASD